MFEQPLKSAEIGMRYAVSRNRITESMFIDLSVTTNVHLTNSSAFANQLIDKYLRIGYFSRDGATCYKQNGYK
jgi:hypothetical protein